MPSSHAVDRPVLDRPARDRLLRWLTAAALAVSAYLHYDLSRPPYYAAGQITLSGLFVAQAMVAAVVAVWVAVRAETIAVLAALGVAAASLLALVLSVYVRLPSFGPFPVLYEPVWYGDKAAAAVATAVATVTALAALALRRGPR